MEQFDAFLSQQRDEMNDAGELIATKAVVETSVGRALLADIGTLAHRTLELIAQDGLDQWSVERVKASQPAYRRWLQGRG